MSAASREKYGLLLTYTSSFVCLSFIVVYTKRRGVEKSLRMINTPSAHAPTQLWQSKDLCRLPLSVSSHSTNSSPRAVNVHVPATPPERLLSPSSPTLHCTRWKDVCRAKMLLIVRTRRAVALNYSLSRHTEHVQRRTWWGEREQAMHYSIDCYRKIGIISTHTK